MVSGGPTVPNYSYSYNYSYNYGKGQNTASEPPPIHVATVNVCVIECCFLGFEGYLHEPGGTMVNATTPSLFLPLVW